MNLEDSSVPASAGPRQQQSLPARLQPLFDTTGALATRDGEKADSARVLTPPNQQQQQQQQLQNQKSSADLQAQFSAQSSDVFGRLPMNGPIAGVGLDGSTTRGSRMSSARGSHGRTASYGTSLLDTLNEEKQIQQQQQQRLAHPALAQQRSRLGHNRSATGGGDLGAVGASGIIGSGIPPSSSAALSHHRHFTMSTTGAAGGFQSVSPFSLLSQGDNSLRATTSSLSPPNAGAGVVSSHGASRAAAHIRSHTLTTSPPGFGSNVAVSHSKGGGGGGASGSSLLKQPLPTNASGILGAHARLSSLSALSSAGGSGVSSSALSSGITSGLAGGSLLASSSLRNSYSSNSLRSAFARRSSPLGSVDRESSASKVTASSIGSSGGSFDFAPSLDESVWGPSGLSNELDLLSITDDANSLASSAIGSGTTALNNGISIDSLSHGDYNAAGAEGGDAYSRIRSYSFNSPPDGIEESDEADIDVLHAAATSQNPALAFRKMMARTHARSKTLANPFGGEGDLDYSSGFQQQQQQRFGLPMHMRSGTLGNSAGSALMHGSHKSHRRTGTGTSISMSTLDHLHSSLAGIAGTHSKQSSDGSSNPDGAATVHIGIGGESVRGFTRSGSMAGLAQRATASASHSRQASMHTRQHSMDFDYPMSHAADSMPTRSLWVGNVDPGLSNQDLIAIFGKYGRVESLRLLPDKECAFVNFLRVEDAIRAKEDMHSGARIGNNTVRVGFGKGESYATGDAQAMQPTRALWIGNIAPAATPDTLSSAFEPYGTIESARVLSHKNCGFVNFVRLEDAVRAKQAMNGKSIDGSVVRIGYAKVPAAKNESSLKLRNPVPSAAPLTVSGQIAEADAITGTTQRGLGSDMVLEPGFTLAIDEDLVAFPYATQLPNLPEPTVIIRPDHESSATPAGGSSAPGSRTGSVGVGGSDKQLPSLQQSRLRDIRKLMEATGSPIPKAEFDQLVNELMPYVVELCTDYVGNVLIQKIAERGDPAQKLELVRRVGPHMTSIGVHKNGTWAVQRIIDTADSDEQRRIIVESIKPYTPQLLLDQLGNYVVQCCLKFGACKAKSKPSRPPPNGDSNPPKHSSLSAPSPAASNDESAGEDAGAADKEAQKLAVQASNQFVFDAIHARCMEVAQGRFGARAIRTCLESTHATKLQQKLVAVALVTNAVSLATNANGHLLVNWLLESSKFSGRFRVLSHQLAPHLRYLATHKLGASTISKILDQTSEPDARDLILNTLFFNPDPSVLDDVILDQSHGIHIILKVLQGSSIGDAEKARIADRLRFLASESPAGSHQNGGRGNGGNGPADNGNSSASSAVSGRPSSSAPPAQRLADVVTSILSHSQPVYPPTMPPAAHRIAATTATAADALRQHEIPIPHHYQGMPSATLLPQQQQQQQEQQQQQAAFGYSYLADQGSAAAAMSFPAGPGIGQMNIAGAQAPLPPAGFGGMVANGQQESLLAALYQQQQQQQTGAVPLPPAGFFGADYPGQPQQQRSAMPFYPFGAAGAEFYTAGGAADDGQQPADQQAEDKPVSEPPSSGSKD